MPSEESAEYFKKRPPGNQIGTWSIYQSKPVKGRDELQDAEEKVSKEYECKEIPAPPFCDGYIIAPFAVEFWQGQTNGINDRIRFRRPKTDEVIDEVMVKTGENGWVYEILAP